MRLIDGDAFEAHMLHEWVKNEISNGDWIHFREMINAEPTIEERKTGKWISHKLGNGEESIDKDVCSECGNRFSEIAETGCIWNICPNCGADMREQP